MANILKSRYLWLNVIVAIVVVIMLGILTLTFLKYYTRHGEFVITPDLKGLYEKEAETILKQNMLRMEIVDSVYLRGEKPGIIVEQTPKAGGKVKSGRVVYLTINAMAKKQVVVPSILNVSRRQAESTLKSLGFVIGNVEVVPSEYGDLVIEIKYKGRTVEVGEQLPDGAVLSLTVGEDGSKYEGSMAFVPILTGLSQGAAESKILANELIVGIISYDVNPANDADKAQYMVYRQSPDPGERVVPGKRIDIWLSKDPKKGQAQKGYEDDFF